jgi:hypothetical protein
MEKRLSYANVTATLALFFALSGGALAAKHYLINSTRQINPKVLKSLKGNSGAKGMAGATGATGPPGVAGTVGSTGPVGPGGPTGTSGKEGPRGEAGAAGPTGPVGPGGPTGTSGKEGPRGEAGPPGQDGAVAGLSTASSETVDFTSGTEGTPTTIVSRALPPGNFIVTGKVSVLLLDNKTGGFAAVACKLSDIPSGGGTAVTDIATWAAPMDVSSVVGNIAQTTLPTTLATSTEAHPSTIALACYVSSAEANGGTFKAKAAQAAITAVQTTQNS